MGIPLVSVSPVFWEDQLIGCEDCPSYLLNVSHQWLGAPALEHREWVLELDCPYKFQSHCQDLIIPSLHSFLPPSLPSFSFLKKNSGNGSVDFIGYCVDWGSQHFLKLPHSKQSLGGHLPSL